MTYRNLLRRMDDVQLLLEVSRIPERAAAGAWRNHAMDNGPEQSPEFLDAASTVTEAQRRLLGNDPAPCHCDKCEAEVRWEDLEATVEADLVCTSCKVTLGLVPCTSCKALFLPLDPSRPPHCPDHPPDVHEVPSEPGPYVATFQPQAWVKDQAIDVDAEGETSWDCSAYLSRRVADRLPQVEEALAGQGEWRDESDVLRNDPNAPQWVREWSGALRHRRHAGPREHRPRRAGPSRGGAGRARRAGAARLGGQTRR